MWTVPKIWEGGDAWILGGGPSLTEQFDIPSEVVKSVMDRASSPSVYSPYMKAIHDKHVIGVNIAFMIGDWIDIVMFGDTGFLLRYQNELAQFPGLKLTCTPHCADIKWIKHIDKDREHPRGISLTPSRVSWNGNTGAAAISVAAHAGAKRIILVGFDMKSGKDDYAHWHDVYLRGRIVEPQRKMKLPYDKFLRRFKYIAADAKKMGIEIINACPDSAITEFRKTTVKELLQ